MTVKGCLKTTLQLCFRTTPNVCLFYPGKKKATIGEDRLPLMCVGNSDDLSNFIKDFEKVVDFIKSSNL